MVVYSKVHSKSDFEAQINTTFAVEIGQSQYLDFTLINVEDSIKGPAYYITLFLKGPADKQLMSNSYNVYNEKLGHLTMMLNPYKQTGAFIYYTVTISRLEFMYPKAEWE